MGICDACRCGEIFNRFSPVNRLEGILHIKFARQPYSHFTVAFCPPPRMEIVISSRIQGQSYGTLTEMVASLVRYSSSRHIPQFFFQFARWHSKNRQFAQVENWISRQHCLPDAIMMTHPIFPDPDRDLLKPTPAPTSEPTQPSGGLSDAVAKPSTAPPIDATSGTYISAPRACAAAHASTASSGTFYGGTAISASTSVNKVTMSMKKLAVGSGALAIIGTMGPDRGIANVSLDGAPPVAVDFYAAKAQPATLVYVANGTSIGVKHTFTVTPTGTKRAAATGTRIEVDGFLALDQSAVVGPLLNAVPVAASDDDGFAPHPIEFAFRGVTPNPSNRDMTVAFGLPRDGDVQLDVLDVQGRQIRTLQHGRMPAGVHSITWDGRDERGGRAGAGVYFAMLKHEGLIRITRIVRLP